jgi:hypothetical protein
MNVDCRCELNLAVLRIDRDDGRKSFWKIGGEGEQKDCVGDEMLHECSAHLNRNYTPHLQHSPIFDMTLLPGRERQSFMPGSARKHIKRVVR